MDWNAVTSFTTIGKGAGISIGGAAAGDSEAPKRGDNVAIAFTDPAFPTLEATVVSADGSDEIIIQITVDESRWRLTRAAASEFGSAKKAAGDAFDWIVRDTA